jgi:hypothetical protein
MHQFQASMHVIYPDLARKQIQKEVIHSEVYSVFNFPKEISFVAPVPPNAPAYAVFLKITGCADGVPGNGLQSTGMRCVAAGNIPGKQNQSAKRKTVAKKKRPVAPKRTTQEPQKPKTQNSELKTAAGSSQITAPKPPLHGLLRQHENLYVKNFIENQYIVKLR